MRATHVKEKLPTRYEFHKMSTCMVNVGAIQKASDGKYLVGRACVDILCKSRHLCTRSRFRRSSLCRHSVSAVICVPDRDRRSPKGIPQPTVSRDTVVCCLGDSRTKSRHHSKLTGCIDGYLPAIGTWGLDSLRRQPHADNSPQNYKHFYSSTTMYHKNTLMYHKNTMISFIGVS